MQKIREPDGCTVVEKDFAETVCHLGELEKCCAFLVAGGKGLECARMVSEQITQVILFKVKNHVFTAQGLGGWKNCLWEEELHEQKR